MRQNQNPEKHVIETSKREFLKLKDQAENAMAQVGDEEFFKSPGSESNSLAILVKHMAGNMRSRWTSFLTADGEKTDRDRDNEFVITDSDTRESLMTSWQAGWESLFSALDQLPNSPLLLEVKIRGQSHTVFEAVARQLTHYGGHVGQIVFLSKQLKDSEWRTLSIPRGESRSFNKKMGY